MILRSLFRFSFLILFCGFLASCATDLPEERHASYVFPEDSTYVELPTGKNKDRPYEVLGWVRTKAHYPTMEQETGSPLLCRNYYNKAAKNLLKEAQKAKGDAVMQIRSVVVFMDGSVHEYPTPECADDGAEGEILLKGVAIRWKPIPKKPVIPKQDKPSEKPLVAPEGA